MKWSGVCSGYAPVRSKSCPAPKSESCSKTNARPRSLLPDTAMLPLSALQSDFYLPYSASSSAPTTPLFNTNSSIGSATDLADPFQECSILDAAFWTDIVPRLVRENPAVRYANMAVHILIISKQPELLASDGMESPVDHYSQALAHYGRALRQVRQSQKSGGLRATILCSMFFAIFEAINGDREAADSHIFSGQRMMDELHSMMSPNQPNSTAGSVRKELKNLLQYISLQVRIGGVNCWKEMDSFTDCLREVEEEQDQSVCDPALYVTSPGGFEFSEFVDF